MDRTKVSEALNLGSIPSGATKMFYAYVIQSSLNGSFYKGHCADLNKMLMEHNQGKQNQLSI